MYWIENIIAALLIIGISIVTLSYLDVRKRLIQVIEQIEDFSDDRSMLESRDELVEISTALVNGQLSSREIEIEYLSNHEHIRQILDASCYTAECILDKCDEKIARIRNIHDLYNTPGEDKTARGGS